MKKFNLFILTLFISNVFSQDISNKYAETITSEELKSLLYEFASDSFEGREAGKEGQKKAVEYIRDFYSKNDIEPAKGSENYFQKMQITLPGKMVTIPYKFPDSVRGFIEKGDLERLKQYLPDSSDLRNLEDYDEIIDTENVAAIIKGSVYPNEYIVITAHLDHVGKRGDNIYNGADDDGSGSMALLEIAQAFKLAELNGNGPKRSIVLLHVLLKKKV